MKKLIVTLIAGLLVCALLAGCGNSSQPTTTAAPETTTEAPTTTKAPETTEAPTEAPTQSDAEIAAEVGALLDAIYVQTWTEETEAQIEAARAAWDALTDEQKELVEGEEVDADYMLLDTGDASLDDPRNQDGIGENEILVVSFGTSYNDSRVQDIKAIEDAIAKAYPDWSVRRAFTAQIIINHIQVRDGEKIDNIDQALRRAVDNGVKNLVIQPTHLMHGAEYDEIIDTLEKYQDKFEKVKVSEPLLGSVGSDATVINEDKEYVAKAVVADTLADAQIESIEAAAAEGTALVYMGHGTAHEAKVTYSQMQTMMNNLGYKNVFIGTVEGEPEETACENIIEAVKEAGYTYVIMRPLMVVAGDHAHNDMAGEDEDSWVSQFAADGSFYTIDPRLQGLGRIPAIQELYISHISAALRGM